MSTKKIKEEIANWFLRLIAHNYKLQLPLKNEILSEMSDEFINSLLNDCKFSHHYWFINEPHILNSSSEIDYISTVFYMVNSLQEYDASESEMDQYKRFLPEASYQHKFNILDENTVEKLIMEFLKKYYNISKDLSLAAPTVLLSHDIDSINSGIYHEAKWAFKTGNVKMMFRLILDTLMLNPPWWNVDKIAKMESLYDFKSTFYWIMQNGRSKDGIKNGDYRYNSQRIHSFISEYVPKGFEMGLHKSTMNTSLVDEINSNQSTADINSNRYHFLRFDMPQGYKDLHEAGVKTDSSLSFHNYINFRNSYGRPFQPFNIQEMNTLDFLEIPFHMMDETFKMEKYEDVKLSFDRITSFLEKNKNDTIFGLLWHNTELAPYRYNNSLILFKKLLLYFHEENYRAVTPSIIYDEYFD